MRQLYLPLLILATLAAPARAADLTAGVAVVEITPPTQAYRMSGYFSERLSTGTHDPLQAKALVLKQGNAQAAFVFCDVVGLSLDVSGNARKAASEKTGIPAANILVAATHSHTGPLFDGVLRNHFHELAVAKHGKDPYEEIDYKAFLAEKIAAAVVEASQAAQPVTLQAGVTEQPGLAFNRRFHMKDGTVRFNPGKLNPDIVRVAGPIDPEIGLLLFRNREGNKNLAALTVFALHLDTVGGTQYSADYPFYLERTLRQTLGNQCVSLFGTGTCGDINHIDVMDKRVQKGMDETVRIGTALAQSVAGATGQLKPVAPNLAARRAIVDTPLQQYSPEQIAQSKQDLVKVGTSALPFLKQVEAVKIQELQLIPAKTLPLEVQAFRLGDDLAIVGLPGEIFVELGLAIKKGSPFARTYVIELCQDSPGYIPTKKAFAEGSYETVNSLVQPGGGERLVETALRLLNELKE